MNFEIASKTKNFCAWMRLDVLEAKSEKEALELVLDDWTFPWQQDAYCAWYQANKGWLHD